MTISSRNQVYVNPVPMVAASVMLSPMQALLDPNGLTVAFTGFDIVNTAPFEVSGGAHEPMTMHRYLVPFIAEVTAETRSVAVVAPE